MAASLARSSVSPVRQLTMMMKMLAPSVRGTQPPSTILARLATKNPTSTTRKRLAMARTAAKGQRQTLCMARKRRNVVSTMVVETAVPNALASLSELRNASVTARVPTAIIRFTAGT